MSRAKGLSHWRSDSSAAGGAAGATGFGIGGREGGLAATLGRGGGVGAFAAMLGRRGGRGEFAAGGGVFSAASGIEGDIAYCGKSGGVVGLFCTYTDLLMSGIVVPDTYCETGLGALGASAGCIGGGGGAEESSGNALNSLISSVTFLGSVLHNVSSLN